MKLQYRMPKGGKRIYPEYTEWQTFYEDTKEKVEAALQWNEDNAKRVGTGKEFRVIR